MTERLVVIGGDAAGMSAASQARRRRSAADLQIIALERSSYVSYSACGEPYHVAGYVDPLERLVARTPQQFQAMDIEVRTRHEAIEVDLDARTVTAADVDSEIPYQLEFDQLVMATGATALRPPIDGIDLPGVTELRTLDDAAWLRRRADGPKGPVVVIGGGYIGLETAEAFHHRGFQVVVLTSGEAVLDRTLDPDLGHQVVEALEDMGITVVTGTRVSCINGSTRVESVGCGPETFPANLVVLGLGSRPETELAAAAGIPIGDSGAIAVDKRQRTEIDGIWSAGDCSQAIHRVTGQPVNYHLGTIANKTGRVAGINIGGGNAEFPGVLGTAITKVCDLEVASTGLTSATARQAGFQIVIGDAQGTTTAGYWPTASPMTIRVIAEKPTNRILGAQIVGGPGAGKRIDVFATAIWNEMTASELAWTDLAYAPPFSGVWDLIHIAARRTTY
ncbi:MAG: FAD-dependent oxidoreductase [Actinomycetia bacterium]|nr:FAD-dependent oxidoreductase [Actinomycetes bacterium]